MGEKNNEELEKLGTPCHPRRMCSNSSKKCKHCSPESDTDTQLQICTNQINGGTHLMTFSSEFSPKGQKNKKTKNNDLPTTQ